MTLFMKRFYEIYGPETLRKSTIFLVSEIEWNTLPMFLQLTLPICSLIPHHPIGKLPSQMCCIIANEVWWCVVIQMGVLFLEVCYSRPKERHCQHGYHAWTFQLNLQLHLFQKTTSEFLFSLLSLSLKNFTLFLYWYRL